VGVDVCEELDLCVKPRKAEIGRERVEGTDHVGVFEVPVVFVGPEKRLALIDSWRGMGD